MAGTAFGLPQLASLYDPSIAVDQAALDRQIQLANVLRQQAITPISTQGRQIGGMGYRISPLEGVAKVVQAYEANKQFEQTDAERMALQQRMMQGLAGLLRGGLPGDQSSQQSAPVSGGTAPVAASQPDQSTAPSPAQASAQSSPGFSLANLLRANIIGTVGGPAMASAYAKGVEPTDIQREVSAAGIDPGSTLGHQLIQQNLAKQNYIAPTSARPGGFLQEPGGNITNLPQTQPGFVSVQDPSSPTGFRTVQQPGGLESIAAAEAAKAGAGAAAKAPYEFENVPMGSGAVVPISRAQLAQGVRSIGVPQASAPAPVTAGASSSDPWSTLPKRQVPGGVGQSTYDKELAEEQAKSAGELSKKYGEAATAANQRIALNNQALSLVDQSDTGPGAAKIADVKNILVSRFNVPENDFQNTPSATISLQKDLLNAAVQRAKQQFGARITQQEVMLMLSKGAPNVDMPKAAINYLIQSDNAMNQYAIRQANDFGKAMQMGGDPMKFDGWYSQTFPANSALGGVHLNTKSAQQSQSVQQTAAKGLVKNPDGSYTYNP